MSETNTMQKNANRQSRRVTDFPRARCSLAVLATLVSLGGMTGCASTYKPDPSRFPEAIPTGHLDHKPGATASPAEEPLKLGQPLVEVPVADRLVLADPEPQKLYSFRSNGQSLRTILAQFAQAYKLNIVPDADVQGVVSVEFKDLSLERALDAILDPVGVGWMMDEGMVRVSRRVTRTYQVDYLRATRTGSGSVSANGSSGSGGGSATNSISRSDTINFWEELEEELNAILTRSANESDAAGTPPRSETISQVDRATNTTVTTTRPLPEVEGRVTVNKMTGTVQITAAPKRMRAVDVYMQNMLKNINRQVYIEARILDVQLGEDSAFGIDWTRIQFGRNNTLTASMSNIVSGAGGATAKPPTIRLDYNKAFPGSFLITNLVGAMEALKEQGAVRIVSQPRIRTLNNQPAIVRVGTERTFYTQTTTLTPNPGGTPIQTVTDVPNTVTEGITLSVTPQIAPSGAITLDVTPVINKVVGIAESPSGLSNAPIMETKQVNTLVRIKDGETVAIGGLIIEEDADRERGVPGLKNVPAAGWAFKGKYDNKQRKELVIFITPHIIQD
jgi:MSHA biogenesis protein MshL